MKNFIKTSITTLGALIILGTSVIAVTGEVNAPNGLVLRKEADKNSNPLATIKDKAEVKIIEKEGEWYKVLYNSQEGYIFAQYVNVNEEVTSSNEEEKQEAQQGEQQEQLVEDGTRVTNNLKLYNMPLITSTVIKEIPPETEIKVEKQITNWSYVIAGEIEGWVRTYGISGNAIQQQSQEVAEPRKVVENNEPQENEDNSQNIENNIEETSQEETTQTSSSNIQDEHQSNVTTGTVDVDFANIRKEASKDSEIITTLTKDTKFDITAETEEWYKIKYTGVNGISYEGYIYKLLVTI